MKDYNDWYARRRRRLIVGAVLAWAGVALMVTFLVWVALVLFTAVAR